MSTRRRPGPAGGKRDLNRKRRVAQLAGAGLELFLARGIESVTIDEIVDRARLAKGSFYRYFDDKAALVDALFAPLRDGVVDAFAACEAALRAARDRKSLAAAYALLAEGLGAAIVSQADIARLYLQESRGPARGARAPARKLADRIRARSLELTHIAHDRGLLRPFDARVSAAAVVGAAEALLHGVLQGDDLGDPLAIPELLVSMVLDGLKRK
jgi:AcrR family transcriptional regulator